MGGPPPPPPGVPVFGMPPPPVFGALGGGSAKQGVVPKRKMRPFHWTKLPNGAIRQTFWAEYQAMEDLPIDHTYLEDMFEAAETVELATKKKDQPATLLDAKRGQNLGIFLSGFKVPISELDRSLCILPPNDGALDIQYVMDLRKLGPTSDEATMYDKYTGDKTRLTHMDQFLLQLLTVPHLKARLDLLLFVQEFPLQFQELAPECKLALNACKELNSSKRLKVVMRKVLSIGNFLNSGTPKGGALGITVKSLPKLADSKGKDKKTTLMDFLVLTLRESSTPEMDLVHFYEDLKTANDATQTSVKGLAAEVEILARDLLKIDRGAKQLKAEIKELSPLMESWFESIEKFVNFYEDELVGLHSDVSETEKEYKQLLERFGEKNTVDSEEIFTTMHEFIEAYQKSLRSIEAQEEAARAEKAKQAARQAKELAKEHAALAEQHKFGGSQTSLFDQEPVALSVGNPFAQPEPEEPELETKSLGAGSSLEEPFDEPPLDDAPPIPPRKQEPFNPFAFAVEPPPEPEPVLPPKPLVNAQPTPLVAVAKTPNPFASAPSPKHEPPMIAPAKSLNLPKPSFQFEVKAPMPEGMAAKESANPFEQRRQSVSNPFGAGNGASAGTKKKASTDKMNRKPPTREGHLDKLGKGNKADKGFYELTNTGYLNYYKKQGGKNSDAIYLRGCTVRIDPDDNSIVLLQTEDKLYSLRAMSGAEALSWKEDIEFYTQSK